MCVLAIRALLFRVHFRAADCWKLPRLTSKSPESPQSMGAPPMVHRASNLISRTPQELI